MIWLNKIHVGDCIDLMKQMQADGVRVNCIVTSPPYWNLRDYGVDGQIGLESTLQEWIDKMVEVFRRARELLTDDGTLWLNLGDSYSSGGRGGNPTVPSSTIAGGHANQIASQVQRHTSRSSGLPPKNLIGQPWRVALALQDDGWYLRSDIIWHKPNPMPESVNDRPTKSHEYIFLLSKSETYYYDNEAIKEICSDGTHPRSANNGVGFGYATNEKPRTKVSGWADGPGSHDVIDRSNRKHDDNTKFRAKNNASFDAAMAVMPTHRNKRTVWTVPTEAFKQSHFATFPRALITPCILAGTPPGGVVLDPFMGSGTTAQVATQFGREFIGCELNQKYVDIYREHRRTTIGMQL